LQTLTQAATLGQAGKFAGTIRPEDFIRAAYEAMDIQVPDDMTIDEMVQAIMDAIATNPADTTALDNLTQATNEMNAAVKEASMDRAVWRHHTGQDLMPDTGMIEVLAKEFSVWNPEVLKAAVESGSPVTKQIAEKALKLIEHQK
jgi:hypothetical protein